MIIVIVIIIVKWCLRAGFNAIHSKHACNMLEQSLLCEKCRPLFHELFLIAVHSHGHTVSDSGASRSCRERAAVMPHPSLARVRK